MAEFPIVYQQEASLQTPMDPRGAAIARAGAQVEQFAHGMFRLQGISELNDARAKNKQVWNQIDRELKSETDPMKYQSIYDRYLPEMEGREIKNGWAARQYRQEITDTKPEWQHLIDTKKFNRMVENGKWALAEAQANAVTSGSTSGLELTLRELRAAGMPIAPEEAQSIMRDARRAIALKQLSDMAGNDPEMFLRKASTPAKMKALYPEADLTPADHRQIMRLAQYQQSFARTAEERAEKERWAGLVESVVTPETLQKSLVEFERVIDQQNFTLHEKLKLKQVYMQYRTLMEDTGTEYINEPLLYEVTRDVQDGRMSIPDLEDLWLKDGKMQWRMSTQLSLRATIKQQEAAAMKPTASGFKVTDPGVKQLLDQWDAMFEETKEKKTIIPMEKYDTWLTGRMGLIERLEEHYGNPAAMRTAYEDYVKTVVPDRDIFRRLLESLSWTIPGFGGMMARKHLNRQRSVEAAPTSEEDFVQQVSMLNASDPERARAYYDKYKGRYGWK